jgi:hypothetical protein
VSQGRVPLSQTESAKDSGHYQISIAGRDRASQQKRTAYDRSGSVASRRRALDARGMSAMPPIPTELMRHNKTSLSAIRDCMHRSKSLPIARSNFHAIKG